MADEKKEYELDRADILEEMLSGNRVFMSDDEEAGRITFEVNCNDLWSWGSADQEEIPYSEIKNCYKLGPITWACVRRNLRPFAECEQHMKNRGEWNDALEALPVREETK